MGEEVILTNQNSTSPIQPDWDDLIPLRQLKQTAVKVQASKGYTPRGSLPDEKSTTVWIPGIVLASLAMWRSTNNANQATIILCT